MIDILQMIVVILEVTEYADLCTKLMNKCI